MGYAPALFFAGDGITPVDLNAAGVPAFIRELSAVVLPPAGGSRAFYAGVSGPTGAVPYQTLSSSRAVVRASLLVAAPADFLPVDFSENGAAPAPVVTVNAGSIPASLTALAADQLAPGVAAACRLVYDGGAYVDVQGTLAAVSAALEAASGGGGGGLVGPSNVAYVDVKGTASGLVGDAARPFATVLQALTALAAVVPPLAEAQVRIGPGAFVGDVGAVPASLTRLSIVGSGAQLTRLTTLTPGSDLFDLGVNVKRDDFQAFDFTCAAPGGGRLVRYDGGARLLASEAFQAGALALGFIGGTGGPGSGTINVKRLGTFATFLGFEQFDATIVETCLNWLNDGAILGDVSLTQDHDDPNLPPGADLRATWLNVLTQNVSLEKQGRIEGAGCNIDGTLTTQTGLTISAAAPPKTGGYTMRASIVRKVLFGAGAAILPDTAQPLRLTLEDSLMREDYVVRVTGAPPAFFQNTSVLGTRFDTVKPIFGAGIHADARGAVVRPSGPAFSTPDPTGDVIPPPFATAAVAVAANPQAVPFGFRVPASLAFAACPVSDDATTLPLSVANAVDHVDVAVTVVAGNLRASVAWEG